MTNGDEKNLGEINALITIIDSTITNLKQLKFSNKPSRDLSTFLIKDFEQNIDILYKEKNKINSTLLELSECPYCGYDKILISETTDGPEYTCNNEHCKRKLTLEQMSFGNLSQAFYHFRNKTEEDINKIKNSIEDIKDDIGGFYDNSLKKFIDDDRKIKLEQ